MEKILFIIAAVMLGGGNPITENMLQIENQEYEQSETDIKPKEDINIPEPEPEPEPVPQPEPEPQTEPQPEPEQKGIHDYTIKELEEMSQEERKNLPKKIKNVYGISEDGKFYTESTNSKQQIENNNK